MPWFLCTAGKVVQVWKCEVTCQVRGSVSILLVCQVSITGHKCTNVKIVGSYSSPKRKLMVSTCHSRVVEGGQSAGETGGQRFTLVIMVKGKKTC